jgi:hypothetical protein
MIQMKRVHEFGRHSANEGPIGTTLPYESPLAPLARTGYSGSLKAPELEPEFYSTLRAQPRERARAYYQPYHRS